MAGIRLLVEAAICRRAQRYWRQRLRGFPKSSHLRIIGIETGEELVPALDKSYLTRVHHLELPVPSRCGRVGRSQFKKLLIPVQAGNGLFVISGKPLVLCEDRAAMAPYRLA